MSASEVEETSWGSCRDEKGGSSLQNVCELNIVHGEHSWQIVPYHRIEGKTGNGPLYV